MESARQELEASTAALLQVGGVSWEAMAAELGVTRQSLHRRLSHRSLTYLDRPTNGPMLEQEWGRLITFLDERVRELAGFTPRKTSHQVARNLQRDSH
jgi:hypothetical protein